MTPTPNVRDYRLALSEALPIRYPTRTGHAEAWWIYPDTRLEVEVSSGGRDVEVEFVALAVTDAPGSPVATVGGRPVSLQRRGRLWAGTLGASGSGEISFVLGSPADGPYLLLRSLSVVDGSRRQLIGNAEQARPAVRFIGTAPARVGYADRPPGTPLGPVASLGGGRAEWRVPELSTVATDSLAGRFVADMAEPDRNRGLVVMTGCSPVRLLVDGAAPDRVARALRGTQELPVGAYVHVGEVVRARPLPGWDLSSARIELDSSRRCGAFQWLYPGDRATFDVSESTWLHGGADQLALAGYVLGSGNGQVEVEVHYGAGKVLHRELDLAALDGAGVVLSLEGALPGSPGAVSVVVATSEDAGFVLMNLGVLGPGQNWK